MIAGRIPQWAEVVFQRWGPQPALGSDAPDPSAAARYAAIIERFRRRWHLELQADVWARFGAEGEQVECLEPAQHLLGLMIDLARYGSRTEMATKRQALADVERMEDELRDLAGQVTRKLEARDSLMHDYLVEGGLDEDQTQALRDAANAVATQSWRQPRLHNTDFHEAMSSRKTARDALNAMLYQIDRIAPLLLPVTLTDKARAAIFNVAHDTEGAEHCSAENVKTARAVLRAR